VTNTLPVAAINIGLLGSRLSGLNDPASPFDGMLIYQRRHDRRPIAIVQENLLGAGQLSGTIYSKWGHVILAGKGDLDARFVVGTMRIVALLDMEIRPSPGICSSSSECSQLTWWFVCMAVVNRAPSSSNACRWHRPKFRGACSTTGSRKLAFEGRTRRPA
jgi:hypothetical protein